MKEPGMTYVHGSHHVVITNGTAVHTKGIVNHVLWSGQYGLTT